MTAAFSLFLVYQSGKFAVEPTKRFRFPLFGQRQKGETVHACHTMESFARVISCRNFHPLSLPCAELESRVFLSFDQHAGRQTQHVSRGSREMDRQPDPKRPAGRQD